MKVKVCERDEGKRGGVHGGADDEKGAGSLSGKERF